MTNIASQAAILGHNVKVLADGSKYFSSKFDNNQKFEIHRFDQLKFLRKRIKSNFANNLLKDNNFDKVYYYFYLYIILPGTYYYLSYLLLLTIQVYLLLLYL